MFVLVGVILSICSILELSKQVNTRSIYRVLLFFMSLMLIFRYGQGTDYHDYEQMYKYLYENGDILSNALVHGEFGWYVLMMLSKRIGIEFDGFIAIISLIMMLFTYKAFEKYSKSKIFSLLLLYPTYFLTYYYSAIRQGLVLSIFLYLGVKYLLEKKYTYYYILVFILTQFHMASVILFVIPLGINLLKFNRCMFIISAVALAVVLSSTGLLGILMAGRGYTDVTVSYLAIVLRISLYFIVSTLHYKINKISKDRTESILFDIYTLGITVYLSLLFYATLSQRITMPLKAVEVFLIPLQLHLINEYLTHKLNISIITVKVFSNIKIIGYAIVLILMLDVELVKNIYSYISQGNYYEWVNAINYPYISIFDKEEIFHYIPYFK